VGQPDLCYLADGKLFLKREGREPDLIESRYAQELRDDLQRMREKNEWKTRSQTGRIMAGGSPWGGPGADPSGRRILISGVTPGGEADELVYALETDSVGGLFAYNVTEGVERRLFHHNGFRARHLARHPERGLIAFSGVSEEGTASIGIVEADGRNMRTVTEGDAVDEAPSWVPGDRPALLFQSAGIGRDQQGNLAGIGPYAIHRLDLEREELETLAEDPKKDFLLPRMGEDGSLYYIRRPYQPGRGPGLLPLLKDAVLMPVRLVWAIFGFLNFFSLMFSGNPLSTAGGPKREGPNPRHLLLWGKMIDAERAERTARVGTAAALVPKDWELVRRRPDGAEEVLAESVVSFDLAANGTVAYTNGSALFSLSPDGRKQVLGAGKRIEHVVAV
jgi:hypothetical protein